MIQTTTMRNGNCAALRFRQSGIVLALTLFLWLASSLYLPVDEELLLRLYGAAYEQYRVSTHRYFAPANSRAVNPK